MKYGIFEGYDHHNERSLWQVFGKDNDYQGVWHETKEEAIKELEAKLEALQKTVPITLREIEEIGKLEAENDRLKKSFEALHQAYERVKEELTLCQNDLDRLGRLYAEKMDKLGDARRTIRQLRIEQGSPTNNEEV